MADLSPYQYCLPKHLSNVLAVGWLEKGQDFPAGTTSKLFIHNLELLIRTRRVNVMRGTHSCDFCIDSDIDLFIGAGPIETRKEYAIPIDARPCILGHAEIWVPANEGGCILAAPTLIYHYITEHSYQPPESFVRAVESFDFESNWQAQKVSDDLIATLYRSMQ